MDEKLEEKISGELLLKYDLHLMRMAELQEFAKVVRDFVQYLGNNQYYSDGVNKKIFLLTIEADACLLSVERLNLKASDVRVVVEKHFLSKTKADLVLEPKAVDGVKAELKKLQDELCSLYDRCIVLTQEIKLDFKQRQ